MWKIFVKSYVHYQFRLLPTYLLHKDSGMYGKETLDRDQCVISETFGFARSSKTSKSENAKIQRLK